MTLLPGFKRFKFTIEYDGSAFCGWQRQNNAVSVQETIEKSLSAFTGLPHVPLYVAGRTDAGVHATGQVAHGDLPEHWIPYKILQAVNFYLLPYGISVIDVEEVAPDFHARFSAVKRQYCYKILNRPAKLSLDKGRAWHVKTPLQVNLMQEGAQCLIGRHDFTTFRTVHCQAQSPLRTLDEFQIIQQGNHIECWVKAQSFLHHQVRNMVGSIVQVGMGRWTPSYIQEILHKRDRAVGGPTAPACGLYLTQVEYIADSL